MMDSTHTLELRLAERALIDLIEASKSRSVARVEVAHDFTAGSFDQLADPRDDFADLLDSMCEADSDEDGPFDQTPHSVTRTQFYKVGSVLRQRSVTVITTTPFQ
jgi:hypothetical protein